MVHFIRTALFAAAVALSLLVDLKSALATLAVDQYTPLIFAGDPLGSPGDSPSDRVDQNTTTSRYAGVGSVKITTPAVTYIGSGTAISPYHIVTAGHNLDLSGDGTIDVAPSDIVFNVNYGGNLTSSIVASALAIHPDFAGFNVPIGTVNDDIAVITLSSPLPAGVPIYSLLTTPLTGEPIFTMVGYGASGTGTNTIGTSVNPSFSVKRVGYNALDAVGLDDEGSSQAEVWYYDFDGPMLATNQIGLGTLGNDLETTVGGGDSGGPAFVDTGSELLLAGTINFSASFIGGPISPLFGSGGGGMLIYPYLDFLTPFLATVPEASSVLLVGLIAIGSLASTKLGRGRPCGGDANSQASGSAGG